MQTRNQPTAYNNIINFHKIVDVTQNDTFFSYRNRYKKDSFLTLIKYIEQFKFQITLLFVNIYNFQMFTVIFLY